MSRKTLNLIASVLMLVFTAAALIAGAVAWFAANNEVGGNAGDIGIYYDPHGGSADFVPGDGFGGDTPQTLFPGDRAEFKFALHNTSAAAKNYVFYIKSLSVAYPPADVGSDPRYYNVAAADMYEYYDEASGVWREYNGLRGVADAQKAAFYEKFVSPFTNIMKIAVLPDDGTPPDEAIAANAARMAYMTGVSSYYDAHGDTSFYGKSDSFAVDGTAEAPLVNDKLAADFAMTVAAGVQGNFRLLLLCDGGVRPTATVNGIKYRMTNSNAYLWQQVSATVVVKEV